jgi:DNA/RNA-binding domain of Phe-tRNA-synthetase-like protein
MNMHDLDGFLAAASVGPEVFALRPDYRVVLIAVDGIEPGSVDEAGESLLVAAEEHARRLTEGTEVDELPHIASWRAAYRAFGAKPQRTRNSVEALTRRAPGGLPRVNPLADIYNAVSVLHQVPLGGEDLDRYEGPPRLARATGDEPFDTTAAGSEIVEFPDRGEVVWCDAAGVTCRRWNWRQGRLTRLREDSRAALFILDALAPMTDEALTAAADDLVIHVRRLGPRVRIASRLIGSPYAASV